MKIGNRRGRELVWIAAGAAVVASVGDLLLLWVAGDGERAWLPVGHYLGVLFIPLYALGYRWLSEVLEVPSIFWIGLYASAIGAAIHGMTALAIQAAPAVGAGGDRFAALGPILPYLLPLWGLLGVLTLFGSVLQFRAVRAGSRFPRWFAWVNPVTLMLPIVVLGAVFSLTTYAIPAAPNLAHILYFAIIATIASGAPRSVAAGESPSVPLDKRSLGGGNPKFEAPNAKETRNSKFQTTDFASVSDFVLGVSFAFRI